MSDINYGNKVRREWFERVFLSEHDRAHSTFQAFVDCRSAENKDLARSDWHTFQVGFNAGWNAATIWKAGR